jgi:hypothetical protein
VDEYVCITVVSKEAESLEEFNKRLIGFWTSMVRDLPDDYERVYAETTKFHSQAGRQTRQYMCELDVIDLLESQLTNAGIQHEPVDRDEIYSKYEATSPEWFQIEH